MWPSPDPTQTSSGRAGLQPSARVPPSSLYPARFPVLGGVATNLAASREEHPEATEGTGGVSRPLEGHGAIAVETRLLEQVFGHAVGP